MAKCSFLQKRGLLSGNLFELHIVKATFRGGFFHALVLFLLYPCHAEGDVFFLEFQFYASYETAAGHRIAADEFISALKQVLGGHIYAERKRVFDSECLGKGQV